jgi:GDP-L-fucose synthase
MKKVLITGASGFIGRNLKEGFGADYEIVAPSSQELNLLDAKQVKEFLERGKFDVVVHCATHDATRNSVKDTSLVFSNNLRMFFNLSRCRDIYGKMLYFGSGAEYGRESMPPNVIENYFGVDVPTDDYGFSKYICNLVAEESSNIYNLTVFGCFGKYEDWQIRFISNAICKVIYDLDITMRQNIFFDYLYIDDLTKIVRWFIEADSLKYHKYNICTGQSVDLLTLAKIVLGVSGKKLEIKIAQPGIGREYSGNNERLVNKIGDFKFTPQEKAIAALYGWYQENKQRVDRNLLLIDK